MMCRPLLLMTHHQQEAMSTIKAWNANPSKETASLLGVGHDTTTMLALKHRVKLHGVRRGKNTQKAEKVSVTVPSVTAIASVKMPTANTDMLAEFFLKNGASMSPKVVISWEGESSFGSESRFALNT